MKDNHFLSIKGHNTKEDFKIILKVKKIVKKNKNRLWLNFQSSTKV